RPQALGNQQNRVPAPSESVPNETLQGLQRSAVLCSSGDTQALAPLLALPAVAQPQDAPVFSQCAADVLLRSVRRLRSPLDSWPRSGGACLPHPPREGSAP